MADDEWHLARPANEVREEEQIAQWEKSKGHWSGLGKHPTNFTDHKKLHAVSRRELGSGSYGVVERITCGTVTLARKHVKPKRRIGLTIEKLREEANVMDRLDHKHILKLIGTYTSGKSNLYLLLYPAAVCDLHRFLEDLEENCADEEDALERLRLLGLTAESNTTIANHRTGPKNATPRGFLQQTMGCITEALIYVHQKGVRHLDLKPKNILLDRRRVYLADFGIARDVREMEDTIYANPNRYGSRGWRAPEVVEQSDHHYSSADIYSLGCIFLHIATVLHGDTLESCQAFMDESLDWPERYENLQHYLMELRSKVAKEEFEHEDLPSFNVKHILGLVQSMLRFTADERPTAVKVNERLSELGGLDQVYHLSCCHKKNIQLSEVINTKLRTLHHDKSVAAAKVAQLEAENALQQERIVTLELLNSTWEQRLQNEKNHAGKQYQVLAEKFKIAEERIKALEAELPKNSQQRKQPHNKNKNKSNFFINTHRILSGQERGKAPQPAALFGQEGNGTIFVPGSTELQRRPSNIPLPVRPSTPLRNPSTPPRPAFGRDTGSNASTLASSIHSTFSRASTKTNESASSVSDATVRSMSPPGTPTRERLQNTKALLADLRISDQSAPQKSKQPIESSKENSGTRPSYAKAASRRAV
ncbi:Mitogen-activated protein kinase kinase kinase YODA [Phlyctema vagabunda]|uniref:Mitogen-activated protein kinase kinase kinase YODA n=1 Tax=Phlyctema vagabunda TaxID=108571 RepID=A0ABR4PFH5_9HELO